MIKEILNADRTPENIISDLKKKTIVVPSWSNLRKEYDPSLHPVMTDKSYLDKVLKNGVVERMTRRTLGLQRLAVNRMTELMFALPVSRVYTPENEDEKTVSELMESIFKKNRINALNIERGRNLFASCENVTLWYSQEKPTLYAGEKSPLRLRCKNFSPMNGNSIYPLFDEYDDLIALSVEYTRKEDDVTVVYFDTYTDGLHVRWKTINGSTTEELREEIEIGKITGVYIYRPTPIWEDQSRNVYEAEWTLSRNGNYIRKNAKPNWVVFSDNDIRFGAEENDDKQSRNVLQYGSQDRASYVTWQQALDSIQYHVEDIRRSFFMELQLPDMSMENMKATPMSGEARKMMFIDAQLKVGDESGIWLEFFDREVNVVRAFMKKMFPQYEKAIDTLKVDVVINPFRIEDESSKVSMLKEASGQPIMSQRTAISRLGYVTDVDEEIAKIKNQMQSVIPIQ